MARGLPILAISQLLAAPEMESPMDKQTFLRSKWLALVVQAAVFVVESVVRGDLGKTGAAI